MNRDYMYYKTQDAWTQYTKTFKGSTLLLGDFYELGYTYGDVYYILKQAVYLNEAIDIERLKKRIDIPPWVSF